MQRPNLSYLQAIKKRQNSLAKHLKAPKKRKMNIRKHPRKQKKKSRHRNVPEQEESILEIEKSSQVSTSSTTSKKEEVENKFVHILRDIINKKDGTSVVHEEEKQQSFIYSAVVAKREQTVVKCSDKVTIIDKGTSLDLYTLSDNATRHYGHQLRESNYFAKEHPLYWSTKGDKLKSIIQDAVDCNGGFPLTKLSWRSILSSGVMFDDYTMRTIFLSKTATNALYRDREDRVGDIYGHDPFQIAKEDDKDMVYSLIKFDPEELICTIEIGLKENGPNISIVTGDIDAAMLVSLQDPVIKNVTMFHLRSIMVQVEKSGKEAGQQLANGRLKRKNQQLAKEREKKRILESLY